MRLDWPDIQQIISTKRYFVLHAPRQTGKTSALLAMMKKLNTAGDFACAYANIEGAQAARGDETQGIPAVCDSIAAAIELYLGNSDLRAWYRNSKKENTPQFRSIAQHKHPH